MGSGTAEKGCDEKVAGGRGSQLRCWGGGSNESTPNQKPKEEPWMLTHRGPSSFRDQSVGKQNRANSREEEFAALRE